MAEESRKSVGAIWKRKTQKGDDYLSISIDKVNYVAFTNDYKTKDNSPDYKIYPSQSQQAQAQAPKKEVKDDDIPF